MSELNIKENPAFIDEEERVDIEALHDSTGAVPDKALTNERCLKLETSAKVTNSILADIAEL